MKSENTAFIYTDDFLDYSFHEEHPFNQKRVLLTKELLEISKGLTKDQIVAPVQLDEEILYSIHNADYIQAVKKASKKHPISDGSYGLGTHDTPSFLGMFEASLVSVNGSVEAAEQVMTGKVSHALSLGGGLHHGFPNRASGFCIFNDIAIAINHLRKHYDVKVLYIDTDAHHGDGVQHCFYQDAHVCTVSFHETGRYLYPGTGKTSERGIKDGFGYSFNFPLDAFTEDDSFLEVFHTSIQEITAYFQPDIIVSQHGVDAHYLDPLTHLHSTLHLFEEIPKVIHQLAHQYCDGKWVALGGGGYDIWRVVPRAWSQLWQVMNTNETFKGRIPQHWLEKWQPYSPVPLPDTWHDSLQDYREIPRRKEIEENNRRMYQQVLKFIDNKQGKISD
ncbi:acetoin utilization protein AcuC [Gracilibacillus thailandensis]|uniref:Acetoin utilization protein AcuC n=1 Tax=Gracilibacillus thailandensis TaxID=563735 RepID=A0A6N7R4X3_9BACI|nr:acetoin utilization protein AcuC [Gracilibacillus thailandensis]MRI68228.1 acetoin utilization protein AcuC [Gracilibacillus thailandensis]